MSKRSRSFSASRKRRSARNGRTEQPPEKNNPNIVGAEMIGNGNAAKLDIREWHPNHERCGKGITLTEDEGRNLYAALKAIYEKE